MRQLPIVGLLLLAACSGSTTPVTSPTSAPLPAATARDAELIVPRRLENLGVTTLDVGDTRLLVAIADTRETRGLGLMFVTELGDLDGMVFVFDGDTSSRFFMLNTLIPLDIAFFDASGRLVSTETMVPCVTETCPRYRAAGRYRYAIEVPAGDFASLAEDAVLDVTALTD